MSHDNGMSLDASVIARGLIPAIVALVLLVSRKYLRVPGRLRAERFDRDTKRRLTSGRFNAIALAVAISLAIGGYYALMGANRLFALLDRAALLQVYPVKALWMIAPFFAALAAPWPLVLGVARRTAYRWDAEYIEAQSSEQTGFDTYRLLRWMNLVLLLPMALATLLVVPERLSFTDTEILWTHYAHLRPEVFRYADARRATLIDGYHQRDGRLVRHPDLVVDFADGHRLSGNAVGDGGSVPSQREIDLILNKTKLQPGHAETQDDIR
jgi:hypothetical protein